MPRSTFQPPRIGAHVSIAGRLPRAIDRALESGCNTLQIFSRSPRMWRSAPLDQNAMAEFRELRTEHGLRPLVIHGNYLTNLAAADAAVRNKSITAFRDEMQRAHVLGADYLVIHPGSYKGQAIDSAIRTLADSVAEAARHAVWNGFTLLLENTAGGGQTLGREFGELAEMRERIQMKADLPVGFCLDTAHCYEAGFDLTTTEELKATLHRIDQTIGLANIPVLHANDSKTDLGSRRDRHENIGRGFLGRETFRRLLRHPRLRCKTFILETPADKHGTYRRDIRALNSLVRPQAGGQSRVCHYSHRKYYGTED